jgi:hypothetical protein
MNPVTGATQQATGTAAATQGKRITIDPITRLEGHGKIDIFLNGQGDVEHAYLQIPEMRGFEVFSIGRPAEEMPQITSRICGVCPTAHHMAGVKALDDLYKVQPTSAGRKSTTPSLSRTTPCTSTSWAAPTSSSARRPRPRCATWSAWSTRWASRSARRSSPCGGACAR